MSEWRRGRANKLADFPRDRCVRRTDTRNIYTAYLFIYLYGRRYAVRSMRCSTLFMRRALMYICACGMCVGDKNDMKREESLAFSIFTRDTARALTPSRNRGE